MRALTMFIAAHSRAARASAPVFERVDTVDRLVEE